MKKILNNVGSFIKDNFLMLSVIVVVLSVAYHYVIYIPARDSARMQYEARAKAMDAILKIEAEKTRRDDILKCQVIAEQSYAENWDGQCHLIGRADDCGLPGVQAERINKMLKDDKQNCIDINN